MSLSGGPRAKSGLTTKLPASVLIVMCFMPVLNLVFMTIAVYEIWRNSDLQRNDWAGKVRRTDPETSVAAARRTKAPQQELAILWALSSTWGTLTGDDLPT